MEFIECIKNNDGETFIVDDIIKVVHTDNLNLGEIDNSLKEISGRLVEIDKERIILDCSSLFHSEFRGIHKDQIKNVYWV